MLHMLCFLKVRYIDSCSRLLQEGYQAAHHNSMSMHSPHFTLWLRSCILQRGNT